MPRTIIIGIDGVPYGLMDDLSNKGVMPNFNNLKKTGTFSKMRSSLPEVSSVAWSSIITGKNPGEHGIFGFTEIIPGTYALSFPDFNWLKEPAFWSKDKNKRYVILNVPSTYPAKELNGVHISGFISVDLERAVFPKEYVEKLKELNYEIDVDSSLVHKSKSLFFDKLKQVNKARIKALEYFWDNEKWDVFMAVFTGSDRLEHFFWDAYEDENHQFHQDFLNYFKRVDQVIGELAEELKEDDLLVILSDHGMGKIKGNFYVNAFLREHGFLDLDDSLKGYNKITSKTKAFALDPARIYIHSKGKYPNGAVEEKDKEKIIEEIIGIFKEAEKDGQKLIKNIFRKEEIYHGKEIGRAPDLVLLRNSDYRLRANIEKDVVFESDIFTGDHTLDDAFLFVKNNRAKNTVFENPTVENVQSIITG
jgi:predicted AlkP superfamily phosphohydrolase/phosphomutase